jgi:hypothetical protein
MPFRRHDIAQKRVERPIVIEPALVQNPGIPVVEDIADVKYDGGYPHRSFSHRIA